MFGCKVADGYGSMLAIAIHPELMLRGQSLMKAIANFQSLEPDQLKFIHVERSELRQLKFTEV
jgi:hypothetical protein